MKTVTEVQFGEARLKAIAKWSAPLSMNADEFTHWWDYVGSCPCSFCHAFLSQVDETPYIFTCGHCPLKDGECSCANEYEQICHIMDYIDDDHPLGASALTKVRELSRKLMTRIRDIKYDPAWGEEAA